MFPLQGGEGSLHHHGREPQVHTLARRKSTTPPHMTNMGAPIGEEKEHGAITDEKRKCAHERRQQPWAITKENKHCAILRWRKVASTVRWSTLTLRTGGCVKSGSPSLILSHYGSRDKYMRIKWSPLPFPC